MIYKAEKGNCTIIMNEEKLIEYMEKEFVPLPSDPTSKFQNKVVQTLKDYPTVILPFKIYFL